MPGKLRSLSIWMRVWLAVVLIVWAIGAFWTVINVGMPPLTVSRDEACSYYLGTAPNDHLDYVRRCLSDPLIEAGARERYLSSERQLWAIVVGFWLLLPLVPGLLVWLVVAAWKIRKAL